MVTVIKPGKSQYQQIADLLQQRIQDGTYTPGTLLPSEPELSRELDVSRVTVNKAVTILRASGQVKVRRGAGTFIRSLPKLNRDAVTRFAARNQGTGAGQVEISKLNLQSRTEYLHIGRVEPPAAIAAILGDHDTLIRSRRLFANDEPTQLAHSYYPWTLTKDGPLTVAEVGKGGSYARLADLGIGPVRFTEDVNVRMPTDDERDRLEIEPTLPVFEITHVAYAAGDRPVSVTIHVMPGHLWTLRYAWDDPQETGR